jgi:hypothetical protein
VPCEFRGNMVICSRGSRKPCRYCGRASSKLCDHKLTGAKAGQTCDIPMCATCATHVEPDLDFCKPHAEIDTVVVDGVRRLRL